MLWSIDIFQNKVSCAHIVDSSLELMEVTFFLIRWLTKCWFYDWITSLVRLTCCTCKWGGVARKLANANTG